MLIHLAHMEERSGAPVMCNWLCQL